MNLDDLMVINDGFCLSNSLRMTSKIKGYGGFLNETSSFKTADGLGYKPTPYNMVGGTIMNGHYVGLDKTELEKLSEEELRNTLKQNYDFFKLAEDDEVNWVKDQMEKETEYIEKLLNDKEKEELLNEIIEEEDDEEYFKSEDFLDQMKWYEDNYNKLTEDELYVYLESLAKLKDIENKQIDKKNINKTTELDKKLFNTIKDFELMTGKESGLQYEDFDEIEEDIGDYLKSKDIENEVKKISKMKNQGYGKSFENVIIQIQDRVKRNLTKDNSKLINNEDITKYKNKKVYFPLSFDKNGKPNKYEEKPLSEFLVFDLSQDKNDIELKYYNVGTYKPDENEIKKNGIILQESKFFNSNFIPLYTKDANGDTKLYNIWSVKTNDYVNNTFNKDVYVLYQTPSGNYSYNLNNDKDLIKNNFDSFKGKNGEQLFILTPNYKKGKDNHGKSIVYIPTNKLKKIYL